MAKRRNKKEELHRIYEQWDAVLNELDEPAVEYGTSDVRNIFKDRIQLYKVIESGIPWSLFNAISDFAPFNDNEWADILGVSTKSLKRYQAAGDYHFKALQSERIIEMAEVVHTGVDVFGNMDKFKLWLNTPNYALGSLKPIELLSNSYGKDLVMRELGRIEHGILA